MIIIWSPAGIFRWLHVAESEEYGLIDVSFTRGTRRDDESLSYNIMESGTTSCKLNHTFHSVFLNIKLSIKNNFKCRKN